MIVYEVNLTVDHDAADEYAAWLEQHVAEMLALDGFESAEWFEDTDYHDAPGGGDAARRWTLHYRLRDRAALDRYLERDAERMRQEGLDRFAERFQATRRILEPKRQF